MSSFMIEVNVPVRRFRGPGPTLDYVRKLSSTFVHALSKIDVTCFAECSDTTKLMQLDRLITAMLPFSEDTRFLCIGSGNGFLCAVVDAICGGRCLVHGVEIDSNKVQKARTICGPHIQFWNGSCNDISLKDSIRYDRIFINCGANPSHHHLLRLLKLQGILVGGFAGAGERSHMYIKLIRASPSLFTSELQIEHTYSCLRSVLKGADICLQLPHWVPSLHVNFPRRFARSSKTLAICLKRQKVPFECVVCILTFLSREGFEQETCEMIQEPSCIFEKEIPDPRLIVRTGRFVRTTNVPISETSDSNAHALNVIEMDRLRQELNRLN